MSATTVLATRAVTKSFGATRALNNVNFECFAGEVHGLVGQNGAGKSTLMNLLSGLFQPSSGQILLDNDIVSFGHPAAARRAGIRTVYQSPDLVPHLNVAENLYLGEEPLNGLGLLSEGRLYREAEELSARLGLKLPLRDPVSSLSVSQQQLATIARALAGRNGTTARSSLRVLILDEPTAMLSPSEADYLFKLVSDLRESGIAVIYISHRLEEVLRIADRVSVLRDGELVATGTTESTSRDEMVSQMTGGRSVALRERVQRESSRSSVALQVSELRRPGLGPFSFAVRAGEILGIGGLVGSGRSELLRLIFGADGSSGGQVMVAGTFLAPNSPMAAVALGMGLVTEDRNADGLAMGLPVQVNLSMTRLKELKRERSLAEQLIARLGIRGKPQQPVVELSGGNQQKVALGKWLKDGIKLLLVDEPTQGVDISAKDEIHQQLLSLATEGVAIVLVSSEFSELVTLSDRILVMREGRIVKELSGSEVTERNVVGGALG